ncbi:MAG: hypothetical protein GY788_22020, partial [bacterium]|nr:hypothetical protein [bacterium]
MNTTASRWRPGVAWVAVLSVIEVIAVSAGAGPPLQPFLSVVFVLTCPGFLLLDLENPKDPAARAILGIGASIAVNVTVVTVALVGDIRRVAPVLLAVLVVLALMPRPVLRRGFARVRALAQGTDVREPDATVLAEDLGAPTPVEVNVAAASADKYPTAPEVATATLPDLEDTVPAAASVPWQQEPSALASDGDLAGLVDEDLTSEEEQLVAPVDQDETSETDDHEPVTESAHDDDDTEPDDEDITQQRDEYPEGLTEPDDEDITQQRDEYPEGLTEPDDEDITQQRDEYPEGLTEPDDED